MSMLNIGDHSYTHDAYKVPKDALYAFIERNGQRYHNMNMLHICDEVFTFGYTFQALKLAEMNNKYREQYEKTIDLFVKNEELEAKLVKLTGILEANGLGATIADMVVNEQTNS